MADSHPKGGPASFRPSELYTKHKGTFETTGINHSKKAQSVHTTTKIEKERYQQAHSIFKDLSHFPPDFFFPSPTSLLLHCHSPPTVRGELSRSDQGPLGTNSPATKAHAFPGTTCPGQCGSSKPPSQVPNLPGREKSFHLAGLSPGRLATLCSHCSEEEVPWLSVHDPTLPFQPGLFGQPYLNMSPKSGD